MIDFSVNKVPFDVLCSIQQMADQMYSEGNMQMGPSNPQQQPVQQAPAGGPQ